MKRPPIIAILGHVDHGKSTLLDTLRKSRITAGEAGPPSITLGEAGKITQSIGAYQLKTPSGSFTFLDTPGHEAFTKMRARGANIADIVVLVIAADDGVKPQTVEALSHIKKAQIPFIVAINKIDLPQSKPDHVKAQLAEINAAVEGYGGNIPVVEISAKTGKNLPALLEMISLVFDLQEIPSLPHAPLEAPVIESKRNVKMGPLVSVVVKQGTLTVGDQIFCGEISAKIKAMIDEDGQRIKTRLPGEPAQILGFSALPPVGSLVTSHKMSRVSSISEAEIDVVSNPPDVPDIPYILILKADSQGTLQALKDILPAKYTIVAQSVGEINESDVLLAISTKASILGFRVKVNSAAKNLARYDRVSILTSEIIYQLLEDLEKLSQPKLPLEIEKGRAKIVKVFQIGEQIIAGCIVEKGKISLNDSVRILRSEKSQGEAKVAGLKFRAQNITEAKAGNECGILFSPQLKFNEGDVIISYQKETA